MPLKFNPITLKFDMVDVYSSADWAAEFAAADLNDLGTKNHADLDLLNADDHPQYGQLATAESVTGLWNFIDSGVGGLTDYDLTVGDVATPDYGIIRIGDSIIGRTSYNVASLDLDGVVLIRNVGTPATSNMEYVFADSTSTIRFALAKPGAGNATYTPRSLLIAGPAVLDDEIVTVGYWRTNNSIFHNIDCDTSGDGADLGVQNDLEVEGDIFADNIKESTTAAGVTFGSGGAGDASIEFHVNDTLTTVIGVDDSDGDIFKISGAAGFASADRLQIATNGDMGFFGVTPVSQAAHIVDPSGGATIDTQARTAIDAILVVIENLGFTATS